MDEDLEKEDPALPLVVDQARQRLSGLNYPEASLDVGGSHAIELAARATASMKVSLGLLSGADASSYLETLIPLVIQEILSKQNAYRPMAIVFAAFARRVFWRNLRHHHRV